MNGPPNITFGMDTFMKPCVPSGPVTVRLRLLETWLNCKSEIVESLVVRRRRGTYRHGLLSAQRDLVLPGTDSRGRIVTFEK